MNLNLTNASADAVLEKLDNLPAATLVEWRRLPNANPNLAAMRLYINDVAGNLYMLIAPGANYSLAFDSTLPLPVELT